MKNNILLIKILFIIMFCLTCVFFTACVSTGNYGPGEVFFENITPPEKVTGSVDLIGFQRYRSEKSYDGGYLFIGKASTMYPPEVDYLYGTFSYPQIGEFISTFIKCLDSKLQKKIRKSTGNPFYYGFYRFFAGDVGTGYIQMLLRDHIPIHDTWNHGDKIKEGMQPVMDKVCLSYLRKRSKADYYLLVSLRPLEVRLPDEKNKYSAMNVAMLIVLYDRAGKKIYSKIYKETLDGIKDPGKESPYFKCSMKLLENQGTQINNDLFFLLTADDAEKPTLEDLYQEIKKDKKYQHR